MRSGAICRWNMADNKFLLFWGQMPLHQEATAYLQVARHLVHSEKDVAEVMPAQPLFEEAIILEGWEIDGGSRVIDCKVCITVTCLFF